MRPTVVSFLLYPESERSLKGYVRVEIERNFVIADVRLIGRKKKSSGASDSVSYFIAFPSRRRGVRCVNRMCRVNHDPGDDYCPRCGTQQPPMTEDEIRMSGHRDCCFPNTSQARDEIEQEIVEAYMKALRHPKLNTFKSGDIQVYVDHWIPAGMRDDDRTFPA